MSVGTCVRIMKWMLVIFNVLVLCAGAIAIGLGAWGLASEYGAEKLKDLTGSELYRGAAIAVIVGGSIMVVMAILGAVGALAENRIMLGIYFVIILLLLILFVVAASVGYAYRDILGDKLSTQLESTLVNQYGVDVDNNNDNNRVTMVWNDVQKNLQCCGVKGRLPGSTQSWFLYQSSMWFKSTANAQKKYVPSSCCNTNYGNTTLCTDINPDPTKPIQNSTSGVFHDNEYLYYKGCYDQLEDYVMEHVIAIAGIAIAIIVIMFLCVLFSICVCTHIGKDSLVV